MQHSLGDLCRAAMLRIALAQTDPAEREAMLAIMREDGLLSDEEAAVLGRAR